MSSRSERAAARSRATFPERFWARVDTSGGAHACWPWIGRFSKPAQKYGQVKFLNRQRRSHQVALELAEPRPSSTACALHHCDNPSCCNPLHLYWGTAKSNAEDRERRGRSGKTKRTGKQNTNLIDLTGRRFGRLTVVRLAGSRVVNGRSVGATWSCTCDCGVAVEKFSRYLIAGDTRSCGCLPPEVARARMRSAANPAKRLSRHRWAP